MRSAISRAYYAAYNPAFSYQRGDLKVKPRGGGGARKSDHTTLPMGYRGCREDAAQRIAEELEVLRDRRHLADYELSNSDVEDAQAAEDAVQLALGIIADVLECKGLPDQEKVAAQMRLLI